MSAPSPLRVVKAGALDLGHGIVFETLLCEDGKIRIGTRETQAGLLAAKDRHFQRFVARIPNENGPLCLRPRAVQKSGCPVSHAYEVGEVMDVFVGLAGAYLSGSLHSKQVPAGKRAAEIVHASARSNFVTMCELSVGVAADPIGNYKAEFERVTEQLDATVVQLDRATTQVAHLTASVDALVTRSHETDARIHTLQVAALRNAEALAAAQAGQIGPTQHQSILTWIATVCDRLEDIFPGRSRRSHTTTTYQEMFVACRWYGPEATAEGMPAAAFPFAKRHLKRRIKVLTRDAKQLGVLGRAERDRAQQDLFGKKRAS